MNPLYFPMCLHYSSFLVVYAIYCIYILSVVAVTPLLLFFHVQRSIRGVLHVM